MLGESYFYHQILRKTVSVFGTVFNDIYIERTDSADNVTKLIKVPISYAPKEKVLARIDADPDLTKQAAVTLPRMAFEISNIAHDGSRQLTNMGKRAFIDTTDGDRLYRLFNPVPINVDFSLYIFVKNAEDGTKIVEQIIPFFTPDWTPSVHLIPELDVTVDTPFIRHPQIVVEDLYTGAFEQRRALTWTLGFTCKTYIWGPKKSKPVIKFTNTSSWAMGSGDTQADRIANSALHGTTIIQPGLTANGDPTSNAALSVNTSLIFANSDFGYITTYL